MKAIKKLSALFFIINIVVHTAITQTTIPNADFETWISGEPEHWDTSNKNIWGTIFQGVLEDTLAPQNGSAAVVMKTTVKNVAGVPVTLPGVITLGEIIIDYINQTGYVTAGIPFTGRPDEFRGYYKAGPANNDSCLIGIGLSKWMGNQRDTIAGGYFFISSNQLSWTEFIIPLDYNVVDNPDSMNIIIGSSDLFNMMPVLGGTLWVDNLSLVYGGVSIHGMVMDENFSVYPDESRQNLCVALNFETQQKTEICLFSIDGKVLYNTSKVIQRSKEKINISSLPPGIYFVSVRTKNGKHFSQKINLN